MYEDVQVWWPQKMKGEINEVKIVAIMHLLKSDWRCFIGAVSQSQVHPLMGSLPLPGRPLQLHTHAQLEHYLPLRVGSSTPLNLFPNFNTVISRIHAVNKNGSSPKLTMKMFLANAKSNF